MISTADSDMYIGLHNPDFSADEQYRRYSPVGPGRVGRGQMEARYNRQRWVGWAVQPRGPLSVEPAQGSDYRPYAGPDLFSNGHQKAWMRVIVEYPPFLTQGYDLIFFQTARKGFIWHFTCCGKISGV